MLTIALSFPLPCSVSLHCAFGSTLSKSVAGDGLYFLAYKEFGVASKSAPTLWCGGPLQK